MTLLPYPAASRLNKLDARAAEELTEAVDALYWRAVAASEAMAVATSRG